MQDSNKIKVALMWNMHQPEYRDLDTGIYQLPWAYLHTIKDYVDMAMHLKKHPDAKVIVNFTPVLLEQIDDYTQQLDAYFKHNATLRDPLLAALASSNIKDDAVSRANIINWCSKVHRENIVARFPAFQNLLGIVEMMKTNQEALAYLNDQYFYDLLTWFHLGWLGENVRRTDNRVKNLIEKANTYDSEDRRTLLQVIFELISSVIPRYRELAVNGQIELSTTPYTHPIMPLLLDMNSAKESMPGASMPECSAYPGGESRARWHIEKSLQIFKKHFGFPPSGCWPSEGAISTETCHLFDEYGFQWIASGEGVLRHSIEQSDAGAVENSALAYSPFKVKSGEITCFFRDDRISDLIGFEYSRWHGDHAVDNLIHILTDIANQEQVNEDNIVSIILDGENAWEHYPENAYYFLSGLYQKLSQHPDIELTTYTDYLNSDIRAHKTISHLVTGSWVYGTLSTWIGSEDKNAGWDMLCEAKRCFDKAVISNKMKHEHVDKANWQLSICEGSDWFWWFGDYNSADAVSNFEQLYRKNLSNLYKMMNLPIPEYLNTCISHGSETSDAGGTMRRGEGSLIELQKSVVN